MAIKNHNYGRKCVSEEVVQHSQKIKCIVLECSMVITDGCTVSDMTVPNVCPEDRELD